MRLAVLNWASRQAGGIETYLDGVLPALARRGHEVALWHEWDVPKDRGPIAHLPGAPRWCAGDMGEEQALAALGEWRPDLLYVHGLLDLSLEERALAAAPAVYFAHAYSGTCISGTKSFAWPAITPCGRSFGWGCLAYYYPRRCGGWSPVSMVREFRRQRRRLRLLGRYRGVLTFSEHMRQEYLRHGLPAGRVTTVPYFKAGEAPRSRAELPLAADRSAWRLLFAGRMERLKGGQVFLDALPLAHAALGRPLEVTFAGDGPERGAWQRRASRLPAGVTARFVGWLGGGAMEALWSATDLAVVPSVWPEPFGLIGPEAAGRGVPVAAFAVGGVPEWLADGVSGHLAPATPPRAEGLAEAIVRCLRSPEAHRRLCAGAAAVGGRLAGGDHLAALEQAFAKALEAP